MTTIESILKNAGYEKLDLDNYIARGIVNGCGGKNGFDFTGFAKDTIKFFPRFNTEKHKKLLEDLKYICCLHDLEYILGETLWDKIKADLRLAKRIYDLLAWTTKTKRIISGSAVFIGTELGGTKYFYDKEKYKLRLLIIK